MISGSQQEATINNMIVLTQEQFQQLLGSRREEQEPRTRGLKTKEPDTFYRDRTKLRGFLVQLEVYFVNQLQIFKEDEMKNGFAIPLLRDAAEK
jgi:hypothetical protein